MPQIKAAKKDLRQSMKKARINSRRKSEIKTLAKCFSRQLEQGNESEAKKTLLILHKKYDKAAKTSLYKTNTINRRKSALMRKFNSKFSRAKK
ncbi:30S ribosomal protein S20 [Patescibacteria group bacterium]|nr:30S ribosomal protein S20 [Patescibacteria group bacterium]MBU1922317.1 30S ribosomal protein S20 [Patescibacteria group bacterium]